MFINSRLIRRPRVVQHYLALGGALFMLTFAGVRSQDGPQASTFRFQANSPKGTLLIITIDKLGNDRGTIREQRWKKGKDPARDKPDYDETDQVYELKARRDGSKIVCKAQEPIADPTVSFDILDQEDSSGTKTTTVTQTIKGTVLGVKDGTRVFRITDKVREDLEHFIKCTNLPELT